MGFEYALVHVKYTIPPAVLLSLLYRPLCSRIDVYKVLFLITIAVVSTIPWDSYLIRRGIWTYPPDAIIGPTLLDIPAEELFFFVVQTFNTSLLYLFLSKPTFHSAYLRSERQNSSLKVFRTGGQSVLAITLGVALWFAYHDGPGTYLGLIVGWAGPFLLLLWSLAYQFLINLPWTNTVLPIALPTVYLWLVDTLALRRGTWVIEHGTKLGINLWPHLEIEEAIFFLATNCLIVFGLVAFDNALAVLYTLTPETQRIPDVPSPLLLISALLRPSRSYDDSRVEGLQEAIRRLKRKSRSFYIASGTFSGKLRIDLVLLYSYCRVADDLVDNAQSVDEAKEWISKLEHFLSMATNWAFDHDAIRAYVDKSFPSEVRSALLLLPMPLLSKQPLFDLLKGFETDLQFGLEKSLEKSPIMSEKDLEVYSARVAGTVAHLCLDLVFHHLGRNVGPEQRTKLTDAGEQMGIALQLVNISRDIAVDAGLGRVYLPHIWLDKVGLTYEAVLKNPAGTRISDMRSRLLSRAFEIYDDSKDAMEQLPHQARGPMRVAVESYMEIGRVIQNGDAPTKQGKATVPRLRRIRVAWRALSGPRARDDGN